MMRTKKYPIAVCLKGESYGVPGPSIDTIHRTLWAEAIGNFNPIFCRYKKLRCLVQSRKGDLSDTFRRSESYLNDLYIEV